MPNITLFYAEVFLIAKCNEILFLVLFAVFFLSVLRWHSLEGFHILNPGSVFDPLFDTYMIPAPFSQTSIPSKAISECRLRAAWVILGVGLTRIASDPGRLFSMDTFIFMKIFVWIPDGDIVWS